MKLDFALLYGPAPALTSREPWGQVGTVGTPASTGECTFAGIGDMAGTRGDNGVTAVANDGMAESLSGCLAMPCPRVSPPRPHEPDAGKRREINVSPASPLVPGIAGRNANGEDFDREDFEERAAIMEFDSGMTRTDAEAAALIACMSNAPRAVPLLCNALAGAIQGVKYGDQEHEAWKSHGST